MSYDIMAELGFVLQGDDLSFNPDLIDKVVAAKQIYSSLTEAPWTAKAQCLATGLPTDDQGKKEDEKLGSIIKNGREEKRRDGVTTQTEIKGYPGVVKQASQTTLPPQWIKFFLPESDNDARQILSGLPEGSFLLETELTLLTPFFSKDDRAFYPIENPLKREWVFQAPYFGAAGVKGLLRWAFRLHYEDTEKSLAEAVLFGPRPGEVDDGKANQGCIHPYPFFWEPSQGGKNIGFEVINPHDRDTGIGKNPIKYEVVPRGCKARMLLLFANTQADPAKFLDAIEKIAEPLSFLLNHSGISAKRTADWGQVKIESARAWLRQPPEVQAQAPINQPAAPAPAADPWEGLHDGNGNLNPFKPGENGWTWDRVQKILDQYKSGITAKKNKDRASKLVYELWGKAQENRRAMLEPKAVKKAESKLVFPVEKKFGPVAIMETMTELILRVKTIESAPKATQEEI